MYSVGDLVIPHRALPSWNREPEIISFPFLFKTIGDLETPMCIWNSLDGPGIVIESRKDACEVNFLRVLVAGRLGWIEAYLVRKII